MMSYATPKSHFAEYVSDYNGLSVLACFHPGEKWKISRNNGYYFLSKRGAFQLRLTYRVFHKLFDVVEEDHSERP